MEKEKIKLSESLKIFIIIFSIIATTIFFNTNSFHRGKLNDRSIYHNGNGTYLMTSLDSYYFMRLSREYINNTYDDYDELSGRGFPKPIPLLSYILVLSHKLTNINLEKLAFYMSPILACFSFIIFYLWGRALGGNLLFLFSGLIFSSSFYWFMRTSIGRFDTDSFIIIFIFLLSFFVYLFVEKKDNINRFIYLLLYILISVLFLMWWIPAKYLIIPCFLIPYSLSLFFYESNKFEKYLKITILFLSFVFIVIIFTNLYLFLPEFLKNYIASLKSHIALVQKESNPFFSDVGRSITELLPVNYKTFFYDIAGHPIVIPIFLIGFILLVKNHYRRLIFLIIPFLISLFMFSANRFLIFFLPFYALSLGYFLVFLFNSKYLVSLQTNYRYIFIVILFSIIFLINSYKTFFFYPLPVVTPYDVLIAKTINNKSSKDAMVWSMWDYGYFLQYYAQRKTFVDGGSQSPERVFMSSFPISVTDLKLSANLIKFFSINREDGIYKILNLTNNNPIKMKEFLIKVLADKEKVKDVLKEFNIEYDENWQRYLFPESEVYLFINSPFFEKSNWWYYYASYNSEKQQGLHPFTSKVNLNFVQFDGNRGILNIKSEVYPIKELHTYILKPRPGIVNTRIYPHTSGYSLIVAQDNKDAYLMDYFLSKTVFAKLFFYTPMIMGEGFKAIAYAPLESGAWKVE